MDTTAQSGYGLAQAGAGGSATAPELPYRPPHPKAYRPKIGVIGCGGISEYHLRAYRPMGLEVVALCDVVVEKAATRAQAFYPDARVCSDYRDVIAMDEIAVVDIALSSCCHPHPLV